MQKYQIVTQLDSLKLLLTDFMNPTVLKLKPKGASAKAQREVTDPEDQMLQTERVLS